MAESSERPPAQIGGLSAKRVGYRRLGILIVTTMRVPAREVILIPPAERASRSLGDHRARGELPFEAPDAPRRRS